MKANTVELQTHYIKTNEYKTSIASGFYGGITNQGKLHMTHYVERPVLPQKMNITLDIDSNGKVISQSSENVELSKDGIIRECQGALVMDINVARSLAIWLNDQIDAFEKANSIK